ncbi:TPA: hypothetical protein ACP2RW_004580 [Escherichia coli]
MVNSVNSSFEKKFFMWIKDALVWIRATDPNLLIKNYLTFRFIDGLKIDWSEKQWGHKRGHISLLCFIICFLSLTYFDILVRPSHQKYVNRPQLRSFFMPEIQCLSTFPAILTLSRSTDINVHLPTYVGTDDGISGSIMLVPTGREYAWH